MVRASRPGDLPHVLAAIGREGSIVAIDTSSEMMSVAKSKGFPANVELLLADAHDTCLPGRSFDKVICNAVFPHFDDHRRALSELIRLLRPGGVLVISHPIGREAVNNLHREASPAVAQDRVPTADAMRRLLEETGLVGIQVIDEPKFYLASGHRPNTE